MLRELARQTGAFVILLHWATDSGVAQQMRLTEAWHLEIPPGEEVAFIDSPPRGPLLIGLRRSSHLMLVSGEREPPRSLELPRPPFTAALLPDLTVEVVDATENAVLRFAADGTRLGYRPFSDSISGQLLTAAKTAVGWIGTSRSVVHPRGRFVALDSTAVKVVKVLNEGDEVASDSWVAPTAAGFAVASIHVPFRVTTYDRDGVRRTRYEPEIGELSPGEWVQLVPVTLNDGLILTLSNLSSDERIIVFVSFAGGGRVRQVVRRVAAPIAFAASNGEAVFGVRRAANQEVVCYQVSIDGTIEPGGYCE